MNLVRNCHFVNADGKTNICMSCVSFFVLFFNKAGDLLAVPLVIDYLDTNEAFIGN